MALCFLVSICFFIVTFVPQAWCLSFQTNTRDVCLKCPKLYQKRAKTRGSEENDISFGLWAYPTVVSLGASILNVIFLL